MVMDIFYCEINEIIKILCLKVCESPVSFCHPVGIFPSFDGSTFSFARRD